MPASLLPLLTPTEEVSEDVKQESDQEAVPQRRACSWAVPLVPRGWICLSARWREGLAPLPAEGLFISFQSPPRHTQISHAAQFPLLVTN